MGLEYERPREADKVTIYCAHCGGENREEAQFCRFCGQILGTYPEERIASRVEEQETMVPVILAEVQEELVDASTEEELVDVLAENETLEQPEPESIPEEEIATIPLVALESPPLAIPAEQTVSDTVEPEDGISEDAGAVELAGESEQQGSDVEPDAETSDITGEVELAGEPEPQTADVEESAEETSAFLAADSILQDRFRIVKLLSQEEENLVYEAVDMLRCWGCQTVQAQPGGRFCEVCGAELSQQFVVNLRVIPADGSELLHDTEAEWFEQNGSIYIVEIPAKTVSPGDKLPRIRLVSGFHTDVGQVREVDEDSLLALQLDGLCEMTNSPVLAFFAVADGIGGQDAGEIASRVAVHTLAAQVMQRVFIAELGGNQSPIEELSEQLHEAILAANQAILDLRETLDGSNMGCTLTAALLRGTTAVVANIGDSRTYLMHNGKLSQLTRDHSMAAKLVEQNLMRPEEIYSFEQKGVIYRSLGDNFDLLVDLDVVELSIGDRLLLCSDGLWDMVRDTFIEDVMLEQYDPQPASERLVELANMAGGEDNISVIVVDIRSPD